MGESAVGEGAVGEAAGEAAVGEGAVGEAAGEAAAGAGTVGEAAGEAAVGEGAVGEAAVGAGPFSMHSVLSSPHRTLSAWSHAPIASLNKVPAAQSIGSVLAAPFKQLMNCLQSS